MEKLQLTLPSGRIVTIREQNGEDDGVVTKLGNMAQNKYIKLFLSGIIVSDSELELRKEGQSLEDFYGDMKQADAKYILFRSRLFSLGSEFLYDDKCEDNKCKHITEFEVDCSEYDVIKKYPSGASAIIEKKLSSSKEIRFKILTVDLEAKGLDIPVDNRSNNTMLLNRELQLKVNGEWIKVETFEMFSSKDMKELRGLVKHFDFVADFNPIVELECQKCKNQKEVPLLSIPDFFYPAEKY